MRLALLVSICVALEIPTELTTRLREVGQIDSQVHGDGGGPGPFFQLMRPFETSGSVANFERMATDDNRIVRAMALLCLGHKAPERALVLAQDALTDASPVLFFPGGCCGSNEPFGVFAREVLRNRNVLIDECIIDPLVPAAHVFALDVEILARDDTWPLHEHVGFENRAFDPSTADLRPTLEAVTKPQLMKALGRMAPSRERRAYLIASLRREGDDRVARLATASALSRDPHDDAGNALRALDLDGPELVEIRAAWAVRKHLHDALGPILRPREFEGVEAKPNLDALDEDHPAAAYDLLAALDSTWVKYDRTDAEKRIEATLERMAKRATTAPAPWDTDSDVARRLASRRTH